MILARFFRRRRRDHDLAREIAAHFDAERAENIARGLTPEEAERRARIKFGSARRVHEDLWQQNSIAPFENLAHDLRYTLRTLARTPGFTLTAILVMALGIGATTALFTVVRSVLLNPLPYPQSSRLVSLYESESISHSPSPWMPVAAGVFKEWQRATQNTAQMALVSPWQGYNVSASGGQLPESITAAWVSWNLFRVLGVAPALGRDFLASDDQPSAQATAILSNSFWKRRFAADPAIVGKIIYLDAKPHTIIGVMPPSFDYPWPKDQLWTPAGHDAPADLMSAYGDHNFYVTARLAPGVTLAGLVNQIDTVQRRVKLAHPEPPVHNHAVGRSLLDSTVEDFKTPLYALFAATFCVLLIACLNVANLLVARSAARQRDLAIRAALGGSRWRLIREHLTESLVLSVAGGALGLLLAWAALAWLQHSKIDIARAQEIHLDWWALAVVIAISVIAGLAAGFTPSFSLHAGQLLETLQSSSRSHSGGRSRARLRKALLTAEVSLTVVLLLGAGLLLKSYQQLRTRDLGSTVDNVLTMQFSLPDAHYNEPTQKVAFFEQLLARVRALPGVAAVGISSALPGEGWGGDVLIDIPEHPPLPKGRGIDLMHRGADPGYFAALQIPLIRGRYFRNDERLDHAQGGHHQRIHCEAILPRRRPHWPPSRWKRCRPKILRNRRRRRRHPLEDHATHAAHRLLAIVMRVTTVASESPFAAIPVLILNHSLSPSRRSSASSTPTFPSPTSSPCGRTSASTPCRTSSTPSSSSPLPSSRLCSPRSASTVSSPISSHSAPVSSASASRLARNVRKSCASPLSTASRPF